LHQAVDLVFSVAEVTSRDEVLGNRVESSLGSRQVEGVEESVGVGEAGADSVDFVDQIFNADDVLVAQNLFNDAIVNNGSSSSLGLGETSLVDQFSDSLEAGVSPGNVGFNNLEHVEGGLVDSEEDSVVNLSESHQLKDLSRLGVDLVDTSNSNNESKFGSRSNVEVSSSTGSSLVSQEGFLLVSVFLDVRFGLLEDDLSGGSVLLSLFQALLDFFNLSVFGDLSSSQDRFRDSGNAKRSVLVLTQNKMQINTFAQSPIRICPMYLIGVFE
jgi:hypothetical protein